MKELLPEKPKRGRKPKAETAAAAPAAEQTVEAPKRRGRKPKAETAAVEEAPKKRGRKPKAEAAPETAEKPKRTPRGRKKTPEE